MRTNTICTATVAASVSIIVVHIERTWSNVRLCLSENSIMYGTSRVTKGGFLRIASLKMNLILFIYKIIIFRF